MRALALLACIFIWEAAACPCAWDAGASSLDCTNRGLTEVPTECFDTFAGVRFLNLSSNNLVELREGDFSGGVDALEILHLDDNPLLYLHPDVFAELVNLVEIRLFSESSDFLQPRQFWANSLLQNVVIGWSLFSLPFELFSPNLTLPVTFQLNLNYNLIIPCRTLSNLPTGSQVYMDSTFWAQSTEDVNNCNRLGISFPLISQCITRSDDYLDCTYLPEDMTPVTAELAVAECQANFEFCAPYLSFPAAFPDLLGTIPEEYSCLPQGVDKIWDFKAYYQQTENIELDTLYFDLADLHHFTSYFVTKSVTIRAETVVLSRQIPVVRYQLNISARNVVLRFPIPAFVDLLEHSPTTDKDYFTPKLELGQIHGLTVKTFRHGNVNINLLNYEEETCTIPPDVSNILPQSTSLAQLDLAVQCSVSLQKRGEEALKAALAISSWAESLASVSPVGGMQQVRSRAASVRSFVSTHLTRKNFTDPLPVPYLSLSIYSDMVENLAENVLIYKDTIDTLRNKLEQQSEAMFDMSMTFEERHADLEFVYQESQNAINQAQSVYGSHLNHLSNLQSHADSTYRLVFDEYANFLRAVDQYEAAFASFEDGIENKKESAIARGCLGFFVNIGKCIIQKEVPSPSGIVNSIQEAGEFIDEFADLEAELEESMLLINDLMRDVADIMEDLATISPQSSTGEIDWSAAFPDTTHLLSAAQSQLVSKSQWDVTTRGAVILLDDSDMKEVSGSAAYRAAVIELAAWGKSLGEKIVSFAQLILQIKDEEEDLKVSELGVQQATEKASQVGQMMETSETNQNNYLSVLNQQNFVIMGLMLDFYTKNRADMLTMARVLDEFCQAYRYNFFVDCPASSRPTPEDDYDAIYLKLSKLQVGSLDSLSNLNPPPQPFHKTFEITEAPLCDEGVSSCPITSLKSSGAASVILSEWWGSDLEHFDRVRIDTLRFFLKGASTPLDTSVILDVSQPALFNDTFTGREDTFTGHVTHCVIMYRQDDAFGSIADATFVTDCSTHHAYASYYSRLTPRGLFTVTVVSEDTDISSLEKIQVYVEGSWMPHA